MLALDGFELDGDLLACGDVGAEIYVAERATANLPAEFLSQLYFLRAYSEYPDPQMTRSTHRKPCMPPANRRAQCRQHNAAMNAASTRVALLGTTKLIPIMQNRPTCQPNPPLRRRLNLPGWQRACRGHDQLTTVMTSSRRPWEALPANPPRLSPPLYRPPEARLLSTHPPCRLYKYMHWPLPFICMGATHMTPVRWGGWQRHGTRI